MVTTADNKIGKKIEEFVCSQRNVATSERPPKRI